jgi:pyrroloquinoline-quinone synthase
MQLRALDILQFKLDVLWVMADAIMLASTAIKVEGRDYLRQPVINFR